MTDPEEAGVSRWSEAVQYLLCNYATSAFIIRAIHDPCQVHQLPGKQKRGFARSLNKALARYGNVHPWEGVISLFISGILPTVSPLVLIIMRQSHWLPIPKVFNMPSSWVKLNELRRKKPKAKPVKLERFALK